MSKNTYYRQCSLQRRLSPTSTVNQIAWIPEKFAKKNQVIKIKDQNDEWVDGWVVLSDGSGDRLREDQLPDSHKAIRNHRKKTGDSTPKA